MGNSNCLENIRCPECQHEDAFYIEASIRAFVTDDGAEAANGNFQWDKDSFISCPECDHTGTVAEFTWSPPVRPLKAFSVTTPHLLAALRAIAADRDACTCRIRSWYGEAHDTQCPVRIASDAVINAKHPQE